MGSINHVVPLKMPTPESLEPGNMLLLRQKEFPGVIKLMVLRCRGSAPSMGTHRPLEARKR